MVRLSIYLDFLFFLIYSFIWLHWVCSCCGGGLPCSWQASLQAVGCGLSVVAHQHSCSKACGVLVLWPGIWPCAPCIRGQILNHWPTREVPRFSFSLSIIYNFFLKGLNRSKNFIFLLFFEGYLYTAFNCFLLLFENATDICGLILSRNHVKQ